MMGGVAGHGQRRGPGRLQPLCHGDEHRGGIVAPALDQPGDAAGNLWVLVDEKRHMIGIIRGGHGGDEFLHQEDRRLGPHAAKDADGFHPRASAPL